MCTAMCNCAVECLQLHIPSCLSLPPVQVLWCGSLLVGYEAMDSISLVWTQLALLVTQGYKPNELMVGACKFG